MEKQQGQLNEKEELSSNNNHCSYDFTLHKLFEHQVKKTPNNVAIVFENQSLTYQELNQKANQLARYLKKQGISSDQLIAICIERSLDMIIAILGVLKAGGAYIPIDPEYPKERINYIFQDSRPQLLLTQRKYHDFWNQAVIYLDDISLINKESKDNLDVLVQLNNLAYVIYTSGSTGQPKGVMIEHRAVVNTILNQINLFPVTSDDRVLAFSSMSFDAFVSEYASTLLAGATLYIVRKEDILSGQKIKEIIKKYRISLITLPPSFFKTIRYEIMPYLKTIVLAGEVFSPKIIMDWCQSYRLINGYGPTETAICATLGLCCSTAEKIYLGNPLSNIQLYILNKHQKPVIKNEVGELYISGAGLARGYLNQSKLTQEKFIANPFGEGRLYKTGDLVRLLPDGNLEFIGRVDNQIKLHGFRIELEEIEQTLLRYPLIKEAVVVKQSSPKDEFLMAYITIQDGSVNIGDVRHYLKEHLPYYMVPSAFVVLDKMPVTPNFKLDRKALQNYFDQNKAILSHAQYEPPQTEIEMVLVEIFSEILNLPSGQISILDNFFELGGTSISAAQLAIRIEEYLSVHFDLKYLTDQLSIQRLAEIIEKLPKKSLPSIYQRLEDLKDEKEKDLPLTYAQQGLWFLTELSNQTPYYNIAFCLTFKGQLNIEALKQTLLTLMQRHEPLRTLFIVKGHEPYQKILEKEQVVLPFHCHKISGLSEKALQAHFLKIAQRPFLLDQQPAIRFDLFQLSKENYVLLICAHHIVIDGWSIHLFHQEFRALYQTYRNHQPSPLSEIMVSHAMYTRWQAKMFAKDQLQDQLTYWRKQLRDLSALHLPTDYKRPDILTYQGDHVYFELSKELTQKLKALAKQQNTTFFTVLTTAYSILLARYSGQQDIVFGIPVVGRRHQAAEKLIGYFVNMLAVRVDLTNPSDFIHLLDQHKKVLTEAYANQDIPFEKVVSALQPTRKQNQNPLFQVTIGLEPPLDYRFAASDLEIQYEPLDLNYAIFDLALLMDEKDEQLRGKFQYSCDLFKKETIERLAKHFQRILEQIIEQPQKPIADISLLTLQEENLLLNDWNNTKAPYPQNKTIHQLFEEQVEKTPNNIAISFNGASLTYLELNQRANQLAHYLIKQKIKPDDLIALYLERSPETVVAILGVLKAGAAYVPIDTICPKQRVQYILQDSQSHTVLTQKNLISHILDRNVKVLNLNDKKSFFEHESKNNPNRKIAPHDLAYVIYTSGSTGQPKGVLIEHRNITRLFFQTHHWFGFNDQDIWTLFHSYAFDFSVWEIWGALLFGGKLIIVPYCISRSTEDFYRLLIQERITVLNQVPSAFYQLIDIDQQIQSKKLQLRYVIFGGEILDIQKLQPWFNSKRHEITTLVNMYGITETTVHVTYKVINRCDLKQCIYSPIGVPIPDLKLYVLNQAKQLVPFGVTGELYVGGAGIARGYLNRPELTKERFIANPFAKKSKEENDFLYKTGDLVRLLSDGELEFIGRVDDQVQLRGYRVELAEIEHILCTHPYVKQAVVLADNVINVTHLIAYVSIIEGLISQLLEKYKKNWGTQLMQNWQLVFQSVYDESQSDESEKNQYNFAGWNSSYTNQPLPLKDMLEWLHHTVKRIEALKPKRVLEIGCGTGLLVHSIAPRCEYYHATDFSSMALNCVQRGMDYLRLQAPLKLTQRLAHEFEPDEVNTYDTVILNSVVQYFPTAEYLIQVLEQALNLLKSSGQIFIGDIRSLEHLKLFCGVVHLYQATARTTYEEWSLNIKQRLSSEEELLLSPKFFYAFAQTHPKITHIEIQLKRGQYQNEMTQFRYDAVLSVGKKPYFVDPFEKWDWQQKGLSLIEIQKLLKQKEKRALVIQNISNARLSKYIQVIEKIHQTKYLEDLFKDPSIRSEGIDPEDLWQCMKDSDYEIKITWSFHQPQNCYDAIFVPKDTGELTTIPLSREQPGIDEAKPYTNQPLHAQFKRYLVTTLRGYLKDQLPDYMVPQRFFILDELPKTTSGKIDRQILQQLTTRPMKTDTTYVAPRNAVEKTLSAIWSELLNVEHISIHDNFFSLGGHSLLAVQLTLRIQETFKIKLCVGAVFEAQTIVALSQLIQEGQKIKSVLEETQA